MQEIRCFRLANHRETVGFVEIRSDLCQEFVVRKPDGPGQAQFVFHPFDQSGEHHRRRGPVQPRCAAQVQKRLVK